MGYLVAIVLLAIGLILKKEKKSWAAPEVLMTILWTVISFLAALRLFGLVDVSMKAWWIVLVGCISFVLGCRLKIVVGKNRTKNNYMSEPKPFMDIKLYWLLVVILLVLLSRDFLISLSYSKMGYTMAQIREAAYGGISLDGGASDESFFSVILGYVRSAIEIIVTACGIEVFFMKKEKRLPYIMVPIVITLLNALSDGGRWIIMYFCLEFVICQIFVKKEIRKRTDKLTSIGPLGWALIVLIMLLLLKYITESRKVGNAITHFYSYFSCSVPLLDAKIAMVEEKAQYSYFFASQWGIWSVIIPLLEYFLGIKVGIYHSLVENVMTTQQFVDIGTGRYNAFVSCFYYLYSDFRWIGVICGMLIFGCFARKTYDYAKRWDRGGSVVPYLITSQMIIKSIQLYPLAYSAYVIVWIFLYILYKMREKTYRI